MKINVNKMLGVFGLQLKNKPTEKKSVIKRGGRTTTNFKEYQYYMRYFVKKEADWVEIYKTRKKAADRAVKAFVKLHNMLYGGVEIFGNEQEKQMIKKELGEKIVVKGENYGE